MTQRQRPSANRICCRHEAFEENPARFLIWYCDSPVHEVLTIDRALSCQEPERLQGSPVQKGVQASFAPEYRQARSQQRLALVEPNNPLQTMVQASYAQEYRQARSQQHLLVQPDSLPQTRVQRPL